jgi:hypothetical protein
MSLVLLNRDLRQVRAHDIGQQPVVGLDVVDDSQHGGDVTEERAGPLVNDRDLLGPQSAQRQCEWVTARLTSRTSRLSR